MVEVLARRAMMNGFSAAIRQTARTMSANAVVVDDLWKSFRLYQERNQYLKATVLKGRRSRYKEFWALKGVGFEVPTGQTFGVIGSNGAGKYQSMPETSTILRTSE